MASADDLFPVVDDGIHVLPVLHERLEYADLVRRTVARVAPDAVAVEVPSSLETTWLRGVGRLPAISVLLYVGLGMLFFLFWPSANKPFIYFQF